MAQVGKFSLTQCANQVVSARILALSCPSERGDFVRENEYSSALLFIALH